jgi:hypothetical protein
MLGIAGFGALASLTPYRPYFLGIALLALGFSYVATYRARWRQLGGTGLRGYRPRLHEVALWAMTVGVGLLIAFPYYNPFL